MLKKIISGWQTGADQSALDVAIKLGIANGGWVPKGRLAEAVFFTFKISNAGNADFKLSAEHWKKIVIDSDGTLILSHGKLTGGSAITEKYAEKHERPCLHIDLNEMTDLEAALRIAAWISKNQIMAGETERLFWACKKANETSVSLYTFFRVSHRSFQFARNKATRWSYSHPGYTAWSC